MKRPIAVTVLCLFALVLLAGCQCTHGTHDVKSVNPADQSSP